MPFDYPTKVHNRLKLRHPSFSEWNMKGFQKVYLQPGESKDISITISKEALSFYDEASSSWKAEAGKFEALVGNAADNLKLKKAFELF